MASGEGQGKGKGRGIGCLICVSIFFSLALALGGLVGLCLSIWQIVDALHLNDELMNLARDAVPDNRLLQAIYVLLAFTIVSMCFGGIGGKGKADKDDPDKNKSTSCVGGIISLALVAGYLAGGILAVRYKDDAIPQLLNGMNTALRDRSYLNPESPIAAPEYTNLGQYFNFLQCKYKCCGVNLTHGGDYLAASFPARYNLTVPYSCCTLKNRKVDWRQVTLDDVEDYDKCTVYQAAYFHRNTCYTSERDFLEFKANFLLGYNFAMLFLGFAAGVVLFLLMCCACCCM